jgi:hypothetical protein
MVMKKERSPKSQTLSLRLDPKTKFTLEFVARIKGQTLTTIVERAIREACDQVTIRDFGNAELNWNSFWDPDEGVRTLRLLAQHNYPSTYDEDDLKQFTNMHRDFFYDSNWKPRRAFVQLLWPKIEEYRRIWHQQRDSDYWAAGKAMAADLSAAQVAPPSWPPKNKESRSETPSRGDMDFGSGDDMDFGSGPG